jgi:hypothetical protein
MHVVIKPKRKHSCYAVYSDAKEGNHDPIFSNADYDMCCDVAMAEAWHCKCHAFVAAHPLRDPEEIYALFCGHEGAERPPEDSVMH